MHINNIINTLNNRIKDMLYLWILIDKDIVKMPEQVICEELSKKVDLIRKEEKKLKKEKNLIVKSIVDEISKNNTFLLHWHLLCLIKIDRNRLFEIIDGEDKWILTHYNIIRSPGSLLYKIIPLFKLYIDLFDYLKSLFNFDTVKDIVII